MSDITENINKIENIENTNNIIIDENIVFINNQIENKIYKKCPKCSTYFEKDDACNFVECYFCKTKFCWFCGNEKGPDCPYGNVSHNSH